MLNADEIKTIIVEYLGYNNYSPDTIRTYLSILKHFNQFLLNEKERKDFREVKESNLYEYIEYWKKKSNRVLSIATLVGHSSTLKRIFEILASEEKILFNPFADINYMKRIRNIRDKILTEEEYIALLNGIDDSTLIGIRDRTILEILYATGLRSGELYRLEVPDFIKDEKILFIRQGKGKKDRITPLGDNIYSRFLYYMEKVRPKLLKKKRVKYIFFKAGLKQLDSDALNYVLKKANKNAGIKKHIYPHMIRHTFATHLLNNGADIREVQILLGHASLKATEIYLNLTTNYLKDVYVGHHPLENELYFDVYGREEYIFSGGIKTGTNLLSKNNLTEN